MPRRADREVLGRDDLLARIAGLLRDGQNVMLVGPPDIGKSALIRALAPRDVVVLDPFERIHSHLAARVRRAIYRGTVHLIAARSLDRKQLGAVRRIMFWFTVVYVPPLPAYWMRRLIRREWGCAGIPAEASPQWTRAVMRLARGRPGVARAMVRVAAAVRAAKGTIPSPDVAFIEARIQKAGRVARAQ